MGWGEGAVGDSSVDSLLDDISRWAASSRVEDAAESRSRQRWLRVQAEEDANMAGLALDLAEGGATVIVGVAGGKRHTGRILTVGRDFFVLGPRYPRGTLALLPRSAVCFVRPEPGAAVLPESRFEPNGPSLLQVLSGLAADRRRVSISLAGCEDSFVGELRSAGDDVITLMLDEERAGLVYIQFELVSEVSLFGSG